MRRIQGYNNWHETVCNMVYLMIQYVRPCSVGDRRGDFTAEYMSVWCLCACAMSERKGRHDHQGEVTLVTLVVAAVVADGISSPHPIDGQTVLIQIGPHAGLLWVGTAHSANPPPQLMVNVLI